MKETWCEQCFTCISELLKCQDELQSIPLSGLGVNPYDRYEQKGHFTRTLRNQNVKTKTPQIIDCASNQSTYQSP